jgi:hypothetical protein
MTTAVRIAESVSARFWTLVADVSLGFDPIDATRSKTFEARDRRSPSLTIAAMDRMQPFVDWL